MAGVGKFGDGASAEVVEDEFGEVEPGEVAVGGIVGEELVGGVDAEELDAGEIAEAIGGDAVVELGFAGQGALVAIAEGISYGLVVGVEADVVYGPAVDGDGADAFGGEVGAGGEALVEFGEDVVDGPAEGVLVIDGLVGEAMDERDVWGVVGPAKERDAATFGAEVDGYESALVLRGGRGWEFPAHRR